MIITRTIFLSVAALLSIHQFVFASDAPQALDVSSLTAKPFLLEEELKVILDGSAAASDIERKSTTYNRLTFIDSNHWRAFRSLPLQRTAKEYLKSENQIFEMSPGNQKNKVSYPVTDRFWQEAVASPVHYARNWSLIGPDDDWDDLLSKLKDAPESTLKNVEGDRISVTLKPDGSITLVSRGRVIQDGKTAVQIESMWRMFQRGQVTEAELNRSLLRGHDQK
jgi:hypothetical protein